MAVPDDWTIAFGVAGRIACGIGGERVVAYRCRGRSVVDTVPRVGVGGFVDGASLLGLRRCVAGAEVAGGSG
jgi:hypothetical protein